MSDDTTYSKADLDKAVAEAIAKAEEGLKAKRDELMDEVKTLRAELRKSKEIDPAEVTKLEEENDRLKADLAKAQKEAKDAAKTAETATKALEAETSFTAKLLIDDGIKSALIAAGVKDPDYIDALAVKFASGASVVTEGDARKAMIGDKAAADAIKEWAASDTGKKFIAAPVNSGGGAGGSGNGGGSGKTMARAEYDKLAVSDPASVRQFIKDGGQIINEAA